MWLPVRWHVISNNLTSALTDFWEEEEQEEEEKEDLVSSPRGVGQDVFKTRGRYHTGRRPSSDDSFDSQTVIPPSALDKSIEYHEALPSSANVQSHLTSSFADDGNASRYSVCRVPMVEWRLDCENCLYLTVVGLHDTGSRYVILAPCSDQLHEEMKQNDRGVSIAFSTQTINHGRIATSNT